MGFISLDFLNRNNESAIVVYEGKYSSFYKLKYYITSP